MRPYPQVLRAGGLLHSDAAFAHQPAVPLQFAACNCGGKRELPHVQAIHVLLLKISLSRTLERGGAPDAYAMASRSATDLRCRVINHFLPMPCIPMPCIPLLCIIM